VIKRGTPLPKKLKDDAIVEAVFELRFDSSTLAEVFLGRIADHNNSRRVRPESVLYGFIYLGPQ
jgi:hypothetical protein